VVLGWFESCWEVLENRVFGGRRLDLFVAFGGDYAGLPFAEDRKATSRVDRAPRLASELRPPFVHPAALSQVFN
jgi:hypothetical protein